MKYYKFFIAIILSSFSLYASPGRKKAAWYNVKKNGDRERKIMRVGSDGKIWLSEPCPNSLNSVLVPVQFLDEPLTFIDISTKRIFHLQRADEFFSLKFAACCNRVRCTRKEEEK